MSVSEYESLCANLSAPNQMLEETIGNLNAKLDLFSKKIVELEKENSMYAIGGARRREEPKEKAGSWNNGHKQRLLTYYEETTTAKKLGEDFSMWHIDNLCREIGRTNAAIRSKASSLGLRTKRGYLLSF